MTREPFSERWEVAAAIELADLQYLIARSLFEDVHSLCERLRKVADAIGYQVQQEDGDQARLKIKQVEGKIQVELECSLQAASGILLSLINDTIQPLAAKQNPVHLESGCE